MSKNKPKRTKENKASGDLLDAATVILRKFRRVAKQANKLSTTQKIVGGLAVLAGGYALINKITFDEAPVKTPALNEPTPTKAPPTAGISTPAQIPKSRPAKPGSPAKHLPFSQEHS